MASANGAVNYTYDGDGNRLEKSSGTMYWYGSGTEILDESDTSGNINAEYVFFGGKRVAMDTITGTGGGVLGGIALIRFTHSLRLCATTSGDLV